MKRRMLFFLILLSLPLVGMKRRHANDELADFPKAQRASERPGPQKELSDDVKAQIAWLQGLADRGEFPNEVATSILKSLATIKVPEATQEENLCNAISSIRNFMKAFPQFYGDIPINKYLIEELAKRYTSGNTIKVAIALATTGAGQLLASIGNAYSVKKRYLASELIYAAQQGQIGTVRFILTYVPGIVNERGLGNSTALLEGAQKGHLEVVKHLLQVPGINVNVIDQQGATALMLAAQRGHVAVVDRLAQVPGINVNAIAQYGNTALTFATHNGHAAVVDRLVQMPGINVNFQDDNTGITALMHAAVNGHTAVVDRLLQVHGIDVNLRSKHGITALRFSRQSTSPNKEAIIKLLVDHGATE